jgi:hypothetical protein
VTHPTSLTAAAASPTRKRSDQPDPILGGDPGRRRRQRDALQVKTCVVLVVSGRPQIVTDLLGSVDALVASWLPGTEGAGVADVLFGRQGFTGKLPVSWPKAAAQEPINIGDRNYDPLYRYGFGLRTRPSR